MRIPRLGLGARLALAMVGSLTVLLTLLGIVYIRHSQQAQELLIMQSEDRTGELIRRSTRLAMLRNDQNELSAMLIEIGRLPQIQRLRIYDKSGTIRYSSRSSEIGERVDLTADACDRCHATAKPLARLERPDRTRIFRSDGHRVMGMIQPIPNEADCVTSECHVHAADRAVLGVLDVQMSLQSVDETVARSKRSFLVTALLTLLLVSGLTVLWAWRSVHRPVRHLLQATRAISAGNLEQQVPEGLDSDLNELVGSFNQMTVDLRAARRESEEWAGSLERRVEEKSRALQKAQDEMIQVEKMASLGKLAAIVAHEINNPLAGIRTYAKLLQKKLAYPRADREVPPASSGPAAGSLAPPEKPSPAPGSPLDPEEAGQWLQRIESEAARCGEIVRNLLSFARSSRPHVELTDIGRLITESLRLVQHQFDLASVKVTMALATDLPPVECDPQQIKQAMLAILINACEAMPQGGDLAIDCHGVGAAGGRPGPEGDARLDGVDAVEIRVRDTGVGMDAETRAHVFEPFFTTKDGSAAGGVGLGLAVVYGIVHSHGGSIRVESSPGLGSTFTIQLPCRRSPRAEEGGEA